MRRTALVLVCMLMGCQEAQITSRNALPQATITSHQDDDPVQSGEVTAFRGIVSDPDQEASSLMATWLLDGQVVCEAAEADADGITTCEALIAPDTTHVVLEVQDRRGGGGADRVELTVESGPITSTSSPPTSTTGTSTPPTTTTTPLNNPPSAPVVRIEDPAMDCVSWDMVGGTGQVTVDPDPLLDAGSFTVAFWARVRQVGMHFVVKGDNFSAEWSVTAANGVLNFNHQGQQTFASANVLPDDQWVHIAATWDGSTGRLFADGVPVASGSSGWSSSPTPLTLANFPDLPYESLAGAMSDVGMWSVVLPDSDLSDLALGTMGPADLPVDLVGYWPLNELGGWQAADHSGNGLDGVISGSAFAIHDCPDPSTGDLICHIDSPSVDPDGDMVQYTFDWEEQGQPFVAATTTIEVGDTVPATNVALGELWTCSVTPDDGALSGPVGTDSTVVGMPECSSLLVDATGDQYVSVPGHPDFVAVDDALTVEAWVRWAGEHYVAEYYPIVDQGWGNNATARFFLSVVGEAPASSCSNPGLPGRVQLELLQAADPACVMSTTALTPGQWTHVAGVFDQGELRMYINGVLESTLLVSNAAMVSVVEDEIRIGSTRSGDQRGFGGAIAGVRVSQGVEYTADFVPSYPPAATPDTVALWQLDDFDALLADSVGGHDGTLTGGDWAVGCPNDDVDGDGWLVWEDCNDWDAFIWPGAQFDRLGDGVDTDCDGFDCQVTEAYGVTYALCEGNTTWYEAQTNCWDQGYTNLASIDDAVVEGVLMGLIGAVGDPPCTDGSAGCPWIGMTNLSGTWEWVDGTPATYLNFAPGEPTGDGNYVQFNRYGTTGWNDSPDDALFGYICER